jgi:hypothetical protein
VQGTKEARQELYKAGVRADGGAARGGDAEAEPLDEDGMFFNNGSGIDGGQAPLGSGAAVRD